jgi:hypothetical protein
MTDVNSKLDACAARVDALSSRFDRFAKRRADAVKQIKAAGIREYPDTGQRQAWVEWDNGSYTTGDPDNTHMKALLARAKRESISVKEDCA